MRASAEQRQFHNAIIHNEKGIGGLFCDVCVLVDLLTLYLKSIGHAERNTGEMFNIAFSVKGSYIVSNAYEGPKSVLCYLSSIFIRSRNDQRFIETRYKSAMAVIYTSETIGAG